MTTLFALVFFIFGTIIGSFLNVVIFRYNTGLSFVTGRSKCFSCGHELAWYELVPLFSYLFLGGRCLHCKSKISPQYPIVEAVTGFVFAGVFLIIGFSWMLPLYLIIASLLVVITVYDLKHMIIPDVMVYSFDVLALGVLVVRYGFSGLFSAGGLDFLAGFILFAFFGFFWLVSKGRWMGLGDAKLALGVGWMLGFSGGVFAIMVSFWIGALWSIAVIALGSMHLSKKHLSMKSEIPFAPFIVVATALQFFTAWNLATIIHFLG